MWPPLSEDVLRELEARMTMPHALWITPLACALPSVEAALLLRLAAHGVKTKKRVVIEADPARAISVLEQALTAAQGKPAQEQKEQKDQPIYAVRLHDAEGERRALTALQQEREKLCAVLGGNLFLLGGPELLLRLPDTARSLSSVLVRGFDLSWMDEPSQGELAEIEKAYPGLIERIRTLTKDPRIPGSPPTDEPHEVSIFACVETNDDGDAELERLFDAGLRDDLRRRDTVLEEGELAVCDRFGLARSTTTRTASVWPSA